MTQRSAIVGGRIDRTNSQLYKELETINFKEQFARSSKSRERDIKTINDNFLKPNIKGLFEVKGITTGKNDPKTIKSQLALFQRSMRVLLICGQLIGLNPVIGFLELDVQKMRLLIHYVGGHIANKCRRIFEETRRLPQKRATLYLWQQKFTAEADSCDCHDGDFKIIHEGFKYLSFRFLYSFVLLLCQAVMTGFCVYRVCRIFTITSISFVTFYLSTTMTTLLYIRIGYKWPSLMKDLVKASLDKYIDFKLQPRLVFISILLLGLALLEHLLSVNAKYAEANLCPRDNDTVYKNFIDISFPWYSELKFPFNISSGIILQFLNITTTINWSYSDVFMVCMSIYLEAIIKQIKKTIVEAELKYYPPPFWSSLRDDYTRATRLVTSFDNAISGIMFLSFASNLFFICLQLFYIFSQGVRGSTMFTCAKLREKGMFRGYEPLVYFIFSLVFVLCRFMAVSLNAANIHSTSKALAPALYNLPSTVYNSEIQRFIEQVHGNTVALSGLQFFYVTKSLILSVAGTIVTYELVLLQFNGE